MDQYICLECGCLFEYPKQYLEKHNLDSPPYESYSGCPVCGSAYAPIIWCDSCGEAITGDYTKIDLTGKCYCDQCFTMKSIWND